jgi:hypothetical protein
MKKMILSIAVAAVASVSFGAIASDEVKPGKGMMGGMMQKMDADGDGMLSKEEFMKAHEAMFDRMKGPNGMISLKDMPMHRQGMMEHGNMMGEGDMMGKGPRTHGQGHMEKGTR